MVVVLGGGLVKMMYNATQTERERLMHGSAKIFSKRNTEILQPEYNYKLKHRDTNSGISSDFTRYRDSQNGKTTTGLRRQKRDRGGGGCVNYSR